HRGHRGGHELRADQDGIAQPFRSAGEVQSITADRADSGAECGLCREEGIAKGAIREGSAVRGFHAKGVKSTRILPVGFRKALFSSKTSLGTVYARSI